MNPEYHASTLLNELKINSLPIDPFNIARSLSIKVEEVDADSFDGFFLRVGKKVLISINNNISSLGRKRFTLAHELGHYSIPSHSKKSFKCKPNPFISRDAVEKEADLFASELLLPENLFKPMLHTYKPDFVSIGELSEDCDTSLTATAIKFAKHSDDCCALIASSKNKIKWFQKSQSFPYWIEHGDSISAGTLTASYSLEGVTQDVQSQKVHATYWFNGRGIDNSTTLFESCVPMPDYGVVLTILWFPDPPLDYTGFGDEGNEYRYEEGKNTWRWRDPEE